MALIVLKAGDRTAPKADITERGQHPHCAITVVQVLEVRTLTELAFRRFRSATTLAPIAKRPTWPVFPDGTSRTLGAA